MKPNALKSISSLAVLLMLGGCLGGSVSQGTGGTAVSGTAAGESSTEAANIERCEQTLGTLAVDDGRQATWWTRFYGATNVTTIEPLIRLAVQQSNCFVITSMGNTRLEDRMSRITDLQRNSGEFRTGSNQQAGQRVAADYYLEPAIIIDDDAVGGVGGAVGGTLGRAIGGYSGSAIAGLVGGLESKVSVVTMSLFDIRSQLQISASEGSATATNYGAAAAAFGSGVGGALSGFSRTPEGKAAVAAFVDAFNGMVVALRNYKPQDVEGGLGTGGLLQVN